MRSILEKAIAHVIHGDMDKAEALFHKFMVEKARAIHELLRQDEEIDLGEGWDNEIKEEEYFGGDDLASAEDDEPVDGGDEAGDGDVMGQDDADVVDDEGGDGDGDMDADADADADLDFGGDGEESEEGAGGIEGKIDDLEDKIDELTAEFDRLMSELEGDHEGGEFGDDEGGDDFGGDDMDNGDVEDMEGEEPHMDSDETDDLAGRMDSDFAEDGEQPEDETMEGFEMNDDDSLDEELADITESVLSELEKVTMPSNTEGHGVAGGGYNVTGATNKDGVLPKHKVNDRIAGAKPDNLPSKQSSNDSFERETAPSVKPVSTLVKNATNSRKKWQDGTEQKPKEGDKSAALNSNFAGGEKQSNSPVDGKMRPKTR